MGLLINSFSCCSGSVSWWSLLHLHLLSLCLVLRSICFLFTNSLNSGEKVCSHSILLADLEGNLKESYAWMNESESNRWWIWVQNERDNNWEKKIKKSWRKTKEWRRGMINKWLMSWYQVVILILLFVKMIQVIVLHACTWDSRFNKWYTCRCGWLYFLQDWHHNFIALEFNVFYSQLKVWIFPSSNLISKELSFISFRRRRY